MNRKKILNQIKKATSPNSRVICGREIELLVTTDRVPAPICVSRLEFVPKSAGAYNWFAATSEELLDFYRDFCFFYIRKISARVDIPCRGWKLLWIRTRDPAKGKISCWIRGEGVLLCSSTFFSFSSKKCATEYYYCHFQNITVWRTCWGICQNSREANCILWFSAAYSLQNSALFTISHTSVAKTKNLTALCWSVS